MTIKPKTIIINCITCFVFLALNLSSMYALDSNNNYSALGYPQYQISIGAPCFLSENLLIGPELTLSLNNSIFNFKLGAYANYLQTFGYGAKIEFTKQHLVIKGGTDGVFLGFKFNLNNKNISLDTGVNLQGGLLISPELILLENYFEPFAFFDNKNNRVDINKIKLSETSTDYITLYPREKTVQFLLGVNYSSCISTQASLCKNDFAKIESYGFKKSISTSRSLNLSKSKILLKGDYKYYLVDAFTATANIQYKHKLSSNKYFIEGISVINYTKIKRKLEYQVEHASSEFKIYDETTKALKCHIVFEKKENPGSYIRKGLIRINNKSFNFIVKNKLENEHYTINGIIPKNLKRNISYFEAYNNNNKPIISIRAYIIGGTTISYTLKINDTKNKQLYSEIALLLVELLPDMFEDYSNNYNTELKPENIKLIK